MHKIIILCGPTGVGKTTIAKELFRIFPILKPSITFTTRPERPSAIEDKKMIYITEEEFKQKMTQGAFLEYARVHNHYYATAKQETLELLKNHPVLFNIDVEGAEQIKKQFPNNSISIFIMPESIEQLIEHVKRRGPLNEQDLQTRLKTAEIQLTQKNLFDYQVLNHEGKLEQTITQVASIIKEHLDQTTADGT